MDKEFGKPNKSKLDKLADLTVRHCQQRNPEAPGRTHLNIDGDGTRQ
jgi:hypothetical protein